MCEPKFDQGAASYTPKTKERRDRKPPSDQFILPQYAEETAQRMAARPRSPSPTLDDYRKEAAQEKARYPKKRKRYIDDEASESDPQVICIVVHYLLIAVYETSFQFVGSKKLQNYKDG